VGYTNVGKSTIMNMISKSDVFAENISCLQRWTLPCAKWCIENLPFLLSDTVGFIRKLPHHLVECFKSTLDEVREADHAGPRSGCVAPQALRTRSAP
jgi:GTP-binding protein HflX